MCAFRFEKLSFFFISKKIGLQLSAQLENVTNLKPEEDDFRWYLKVILIFAS